ncbi:MAG: radical SAM family heme chaperone HemW [Clostridiales bacterium]|nr:radical SAM family heme chaperone HemW [Clostridiales bacterium]
MAGIYIHIPFCVKKCDYCDFVSFESENTEKVWYVASLKYEIILASKEYQEKTYNTIFIGGGTPSTLPLGAVAEIINTIRTHFKISQSPEISIEVNPNTASLEKLSEYYSAGVNRISIGLQSANDDLLKSIGRVHSFSDFQNTVTDAKKVGFTNINADIMYGLPNQKVQDYLDTIHAVVDFGVTHISAYSLILEEGTRLFNAINKGEIALPDSETEYQMHSLGKELLIKHGYGRYEISNYAKAGYECRHNLNYWDLGEYVGVGLNSHSAMLEGDSLTRFCNTSDLKGYYLKLQAGLLPIENKEIIPKQEEMFEFFMMGLRKTNGILISEFQNRFSISPFEVFLDAMNSNAKKGFLCYDNNAIWLNDSGLDFQNQVLADFLE